MLVSHSREKLLNAMVFFVNNTECCKKTKLFKLLYLLDIRHYTEIGKSVTGLKYQAWKFGPCSKELFDEVTKTANKKEETELNHYFNFFFIPREDGVDELLFDSKKEFDDSHFSRRELRILKEISEEFKSVNANEIVEKTHEQDSPWYKVWEIDKNPNGEIPLDFYLKKDNPELMEEIKEREQFWAKIDDSGNDFIF
ncbi:SocA family protein [bacterium]|nr:SocA family protein [bacterium]